MSETTKTNCQTPQRQGLSGHIELPTMLNGLDIQDQAQAAMAALVPHRSEGADALLTELRLFAAECRDEWQRMMYLTAEEIDRSPGHDANTRRAELRSLWQAREALIRRVITVLESTL